jgi:hypothetical protein
MKGANDGAPKTRPADLTQVSSVGQHDDYLNGMMAPSGRANANFPKTESADTIRAQVRLGESLPWKSDIRATNLATAKEALETALEQYELGAISVHGMDRIAQKFFGQPWVQVEQRVMDWYQSGF